MEHAERAGEPVLLADALSSLAFDRWFGGGGVQREPARRARTCSSAKAAAAARDDTAPMLLAMQLRVVRGAGRGAPDPRRGARARRRARSRRPRGLRPARARRARGAGRALAAGGRPRAAAARGVDGHGVLQLGGRGPLGGCARRRPSRPGGVRARARRAGARHLGRMRGPGVEHPLPAGARLPRALARRRGGGRGAARGAAGGGAAAGVPGAGAVLHRPGPRRGAGARRRPRGRARRPGRARSARARARPDAGRSPRPCGAAA